MATQRLSMRKLREILKLKYETRLTHREIANVLRMHGVEIGVNRDSAGTGIRPLAVPINM